MCGSRRHGAAGVTGVIAEVVLDRPEAMNAISTALAGRLTEVCTELAADRQVRAVVLRRRGPRAFCVGADLKERAAMTDAGLMAQRLVFRAAFGSVLGIAAAGDRRGTWFRARRRLRTGLVL